MSLSDLINRRKVLFENIFDHAVDNDDEAIKIIRRDSINAMVWIKDWWGAYKKWENADTFNDAVQDDRMTMRSFGSDFSKEVHKNFSPITIAAPSKFFKDSEFTKLGFDEQREHDTKFKEAAKSSGMYSAKRGIDSSEFADPKNFETRMLKYEHGLHDLSVKLLVKNSDVKAQSHHAAQPNPHFSFFPLSKGEDQQVIFKLSQYAKALRIELPTLYELIHTIRSKMTRVKLANDYDMGTGYRAVPVDNEDLPYKVSYSLGGTTKLRATENEPQKVIITTKEILRQRQQAYFQHRASIARAGNEIVIALRRHKSGRFPVYAVYDGADLKCFDVNDSGQMVLNRKTISLLGVANFTV